MNKYYEVYCINKYGDTFIIDVSVDISDVLDYMCCNIITVYDETIKRYIYLMFRKYQPQYHVDIIVPVDYQDAFYGPFDLMSFLMRSH